VAELGGLEHGPADDSATPGFGDSPETERSIEAMLERRLGSPDRSGRRSLDVPQRRVEATHDAARHGFRIRITAR
jgi:hypothetical protein